MRKTSNWLWLQAALVITLHIALPAAAQMAPEDSDLNGIFGSPSAKATVTSDETALPQKNPELEFDNITIDKLNQEFPKSTQSETGSNLGLLEIEEQIAFDGFEKSKDLLARAVLVQVYEKMAYALCFPSLNAILSKAEFKPGQNCESILSKLEKVHVNNTILVCARKGLESVECSQSFEQQKVRKASPNDSDNFSMINSKFNPSEDPLTKDRFKSLQNQIIKANENYSSLKSIANLRILENASFSILTMLCRNQMLELSKAIDKTDTRVSSKSLASLADSIKNLEDSIKPTPTANVETEDLSEQNNFFRTRLLAESCYDTITDLSNIDTRLPSAVCFKDSFLAPSCLSALRRFRTLKDDKTENLPTPTPKDSLSSF